MRVSCVRVGLSLMAGVFLSGCDFVSMEHVPSGEVIRGWIQRFLVSPYQIQGVYRNMDIDSLVFTYTTKLDGEAAFWSGLQEGLQGSRWAEAELRGPVREYRRTYRKGEGDAERPDMSIFTSFEVARVFFEPKSRTVVVGYVQADGSSKDTKFEDTGECKWAEKAIWPRFRDLVV